MGTPAIAEASRVNITEKTDEEVLAIARPLWLSLVRHSNEGNYGEFARKSTHSASSAGAST